MKTKGFLVCFIGIDGSGKTTLSKDLVNSLNKREIKCEYVYGRLSPFILKPFILIGDLIFLRDRNALKNYQEYFNTKRKAIEKHSFLSRIYQQILLLDYSLQIFFKVKIPLIFGKNIVCDRYVYDTVITDLSVDMNYSKDKVMKLLNNLLHFFPEPDIIFLIDVPEEVAYHRKSDVPSIRYLKERRGMYLELGKEYGMMILDGTKNLEELKDLIQKKVLEKVEVK